MLPWVHQQQKKTLSVFTDFQKSAQRIQDKVLRQMSTQQKIPKLIRSEDIIVKMQQLGEKKKRTIELNPRNFRYWNFFKYRIQNMFNIFKEIKESS